jgi:hypothetical protein
LIKKNRKNIAHFYWLIATPSIVVIWPEQIPAIIAKISAVTGIVLSAVGYSGSTIREQTEKKVKQ